MVKKREFAVFEKIKRFFILFFGWVLQRGGQGPGKGPNEFNFLQNILGRFLNRVFLGNKFVNTG